LKYILFATVFLFLVISQSAFGQYFDTPGLANTFPVETGGYVFEVETVSNFDISDYKFSSDDKRLTFFISSSVQNNLGEFQIPKNLINGNFTFFLDDQEIFPDVKTSEIISFITVKFSDSGLHKLDIIGTTYLPESRPIDESETPPLYTNPMLPESEFGLLLILGIVAAAVTIGAIFIKKRKHNHSLTKD
jgi:hypothetical protein